MQIGSLDKSLPVIQDADLYGKVVLVRFDHNVVKGGVIVDPYRIDQTLGTLYSIVERGGRPVIMTHIGRPRDKKTGKITCNASNSVKPIVEYLEQRLHTNLVIPELDISGQSGITGIGDSVHLAVEDLKKRRIGGIYLPNTRWFRGEEDEGFFRHSFAVQLASVADVYINDAFGSWQPHVSTYDVTKYLPSYAGFLLQQEIENLDRVLNPVRPFLAVIAGAKYDTKIEPLYTIYNKADNLILGGVIYNTYLCAKYGVSIQGVSKEDIEAAKKLVNMDRDKRKIVEFQYIVESDTMDGKIESKYRVISVKDFKCGDKYKHILDVDYRSFEDRRIFEVIMNAKTIFVNAVLGYTPYFTSGTEALDRTIDRNKKAFKLYGGGDTLQVFKNLCPRLYMSAIGDEQYYFFTGGGTVLKAIELGSAYRLKPVQALIENRQRFAKA